MSKIFDAHAHHLFDMPIAEAIDIFQKERELLGVERFALMSIPNDVNPQGEFHLDHMQNIRMLFIKHAFPNVAYAFAGLEHPLNVADMDDETLSKEYLRQAQEYMAAGYDGMKMLEGYPSCRKVMQRELCHKVYDKYYAYLEANNVPITMHVGNPEANWDISRADAHAIKMGRVYDSSYPTLKQLQGEVFSVMDKFPKLRLALAHFGFLNYDINTAKRWLGDYENTLLDLTPGGDQLILMQKDKEAWLKFFDEYQDRIIYGTDLYAFPLHPEGDTWETMTTRRPYFVRDFLGTDTEHTYIHTKFTGINVPENILQKVFYDNAMREYGEPKKIDLAYMRRKAQELLLVPNKIRPFADEDLRYILTQLDK